VTRRRRRGHDSEGQASVELALALPIVFVVLLAVVHVGLVARDQVLVTHAAHEAARAAAVGADAQGAARSSAGLTSSALTVTESRAGDWVRIDVAYESDPGVPLIGRLVRRRTLHATAVMRVEPPP
jgi:Flp pilus assembly protein TadG